MPHLVSPPCIHLPPTFNWLILSLQAHPLWAIMPSCLRTPADGGEALQVLWGHHDVCLTLEWFHATSISQSELSSLTSLKAWGNPEKFRSDVTFLLILTEEGTVGDRVYGLSLMWVHPYQARVSTMDEAVKQLTPLISTGPDWPYALVQFNGDACHAPLPTEGHLSIMVEGNTSSVTCSRISQLEVHQLLSSGSRVMYPVGINGCEVPMIASLPEPLAKGTTMLGGELIYLPVDIPQSTTKGQEPKALPLDGHSTPKLTASPIRAPLSKVEGHVSMNTEVMELLSQATLDTSGHTSVSSTPKRLEPLVLVTPLPPKWEDLAKPVDMSSQVSAPDDAEMEDGSLEEIPATSFPNSQNSRAQQQCPSLRCCLSPGGGQQGLGRLTSDQVLNWHPLLETCCWLWYDSLT